MSLELLAGFTVLGLAILVALPRPWLYTVPVALGTSAVVGGIALFAGWRGLLVATFVAFLFEAFHISAHGYSMGHVDLPEHEKERLRRLPWYRKL